MQPLQGIRVIACEHVLAGPYCTLLLADMGAEVIKIEPPGTGDHARGNPPIVENERGERESGYFISLNRNKKSLTLNLKHPRGREIFLGLIRKADVLVSNFRPGTLAKLGLDDATLRQANPRLIIANISGFGDPKVGGKSPYWQRPCFDIIAQAMGGLMGITGPAGGPPTRVGASIGDIAAGMFAALGVIAALFARERGNAVPQVDVAMVDAVTAILENAIIRCSIAGKSPGPVGNQHPSIAPFDSFACKDGYVVIAGGNERTWQNLCRAMNREDLMNDARFATNADRVTNYPQLKAIIEAWTRERTKAEIIELFVRYDCPVGPVNTVEEVINDPHTLARQMVLELDQPVAGRVKVAGSPVKFSSAAWRAVSPAPLLGQNTGEVLQDLLGMGEQEIQELRMAGIV